MKNSTTQTLLDKIKFLLYSIKCKCSLWKETNCIRKQFSMCHVFFQKQGWRVGGTYFPSIQKLIHHHASGAPITTKSQPVLLKYPVLRENWQLSNDQIKLENKIGNVSFKKKWLYSFNVLLYFFYFCLLLSFSLFLKNNNICQ